MRVMVCDRCGKEMEWRATSSNPREMESQGINVRLSRREQVLLTPPSDSEELLVTVSIRTKNDAGIDQPDLCDTCVKRIVMEVLRDVRMLPLDPVEKS